MLGNYAPGRFATLMQVLERFAQPFPAKGAQGICNWDDPRVAA